MISSTFLVQSESVSFKENILSHLKKECMTLAREEGSLTMDSTSSWTSLNPVTKFHLLLCNRPHGVAFPHSLPTCPVNEADPGRTPRFPLSMIPLSTPFLETPHP